jgi:hypothetical protein
MPVDQITPQRPSLPGVGIYGLPVHDRRRLLLGAEFAIAAGPRATAEFLLEAVLARDDLPALLDRLDAWRARMPADVVRGVAEVCGADRLPLRAVPR